MSVREVGLRDGLQSLSQVVDTGDKLAWIQEEYSAGVLEIEVTSFVPPALMPQLADGETVTQYAKTLPELTVSALVPNAKGARRAISLGVDKINFVISASDSHNLANVRRSTAESLEEFKRVVESAREHLSFKPRISAGISTAFGCTIEGAIDEGFVCALASDLATSGADEISLADTVGYAHPAAVRRLFTLVQDHIGPSVPVAAHFHDTRGLGLANSLAALDVGVRAFDASLGGLGGCPHAPGATGNVSIEDLVFMFESMGYATGIRIEELLKVHCKLQKILPNVPLHGHVASAGLPLGTKQ